MTIDLELIACRDVDPELFHPERSGERVREAKKICSGCSQKMACLAEALELDADGIWGETTARERNKMRKRVVA